MNFGIDEIGIMNVAYQSCFIFPIFGMIIDFIKNTNGSYSITIVDTDDSKDLLSPILSYSFVENYKLDNGTIIKNVMKLKTTEAYLDIAYIEGPIPSIRIYQLEDMQNNLLVTQGKRLKDLSPTSARKKCF
jgi:hypothetical protein